MNGIAIWWEGIPGLDWRYLPNDNLFGDRMVAIACAARVYGTSAITSREIENNADTFFTWLQGASPEDERWDGYLRRLGLAMASGSGLTDTRPQKIIKQAEWYRTYLTKPASKRGGWI